MKVIAGVLVFAAVCLGATVALAALDENVFPPPGGVPTVVEEWNGTAWVALDPVTDHRAECFHVGDTYTYWCNGQYVNDGTAGGVKGQVEVGPWKFYDDASVAQYLEARLTKNGLAWYITKPYIIDPTGAEVDRYWKADSVELALKSNGNIRVDFVGFDPLQGRDHPKTIPSKWWMQLNEPQPPPDSPLWMTGSWSIEVPENLDHPLLSWHLWNMLQTSKCTSSCLYSDTGAIYFVLEEQKPWVPIKLQFPTQPRVDP